ncbi:ABC transporter substrate-binding protein [Acidobacteria bacterium AB60]|nr:ABC transporter substrate-binding protein [Acidobacteria bacterium AB60]
MLRLAFLLIRSGAPVLAVLTVLCVAGCRSGRSEVGSARTMVRLQLDWYPQPEVGGFFAAQQSGYYKAEGLDLTILPLPQYGSVAQQVATGKAEFGLGSSDQILEWNANGLPLLAVAATMQHDPQAVMVHEQSPIRAFKDLDGHTIAAQTGATWLKYVISRYGLHQVRQVPTTLSIANFLADPGYVQQIFITSEPFFAKQAGATVRTLLISDSGYDPYRVQFTTRQFAAQHPDVVAKFVRASILGWRDYLKDPGPTNAYLLTLNPALNPAQESYTAEALKRGAFITGSKGDESDIGVMSPERWRKNYMQLKSLGILVSPIDPASVYSLEYLRR